MKPQEFRAIRKNAGLSQGSLARLLGLGRDGGRAVRRWEGGERSISGPVTICMRALDLGLLQPGEDGSPELRATPKAKGRRSGQGT